MFGGFVAPEADSTPRYFTDVNDSAAANFVAVMAQASRIFVPYDGALAADVSRGGAQELRVPGGPDRWRTTTNVEAFSTGDYDVKRTDSDNRLWAAAELWETTGEAPFLAYFEEKAATVSVTDIFDWDNLGNMAVFTYLTSKREGRSAELVTALTTKVVTSADNLTAKADASAFGRAISGYYWGSNGGVARVVDQPGDRGAAESGRRGQVPRHDRQAARSPAGPQLLRPLAGHDGGLQPAAERPPPPVDRRQDDQPVSRAAGRRRRGAGTTRRRPGSTRSVTDRRTRWRSTGMPRWSTPPPR